MPLALELGVHPGVIRRHQLRRLAGRRGAKYPLLELVLRQRLGLVGADPRRAHRPEVLGDRPDREAEPPRHRLQGDQLLQLRHGAPLVRHRPRSPGAKPRRRRSRAADQSPAAGSLRHDRERRTTRGAKVFTIPRNPVHVAAESCSPSRGNPVHDRVEYAIRLRNRTSAKRAHAKKPAAVAPPAWNGRVNIWATARTQRLFDVSSYIRTDG